MHALKLRKAATATDQAGGQEKAPSAGEPLLIDARIAAGLCGISERSWRRLEHLGQIGPERIELGRSVKYRTAEVRAWIACGCKPREEWEWDQGKG
jgi:predicted DNA-binding transcriptional regulator AlpA